MAYPVGAVERAMKVQEVILRALTADPLAETGPRRRGSGAGNINALRPRSPTPRCWPPSP